MPYKDPEVAKERRRAYHQALRARDPEYQKRQYQKHRDKRREAKRAEYAADPEKFRARNQDNYTKHAEKRAADARRYRAEHREKVNAEARASYHRNKAKNRARRKQYYIDNYDKIYTAIQRWRKRNPDRELLYHAKRLLNEATGIRIAEIPDELAEAKAMQIKLHRTAQAIEAQSAMTEGHGPKDESAVATPCAQSQSEDTE